MINKTPRRQFLKQGATLALGTVAVVNIPSNVLAAADKLTAHTAEQIPFTLPPLPYEYAALEPFIDAKTMEIHHSKHHNAYVTNLNKALTELKNPENLTITTICSNVSKYAPAIRNNAGGHYNHSLFWSLLSPKKQEATDNLKITQAITRQFGSTAQFKTKFTDAAKGVFGSGWAWLVVKNDNTLEIGTTPNQDNPIMDNSTFKGKPVLALDVWEHAYYLKHQNLRADYIADWWNVVNWEQVEKLFVQN
jgi:superoxide dismutase, Fe-Mn family